MTGVDHEILTPEEAADYLRVNPHTIYRLLRAGKCPGMKIGRQWRIRRHDLGACFVHHVPAKSQPNGALPDDTPLA